MKVRAFVTGATGFIGRRLVERLKCDDVEVVALVRNDRHGLPEDVKTVYGDITSMDSLGSSGTGCNRLYHLAAMISFDPGKRKDLMHVNGNGTINMLQAARNWNIERSVVVSSACTIGLSHRKDLILNEDSFANEALVKSNPYLESKLETERAAIGASRGQMVTIVNPTTVYGPGDRTLNSGTLVSTIAKSAAMPLPPGGSNVVDVDDVVEGIIAAGEYGGSGKRYIFGGSNLAFSQIFSTIADTVGHHPVFVPMPQWMRIPMAAGAWFTGGLLGSRLITPQIINDMFIFKFFSSDLAKRELNWLPKYSFKKSVERAWTFYRNEGLI